MESEESTYLLDEGQRDHGLEAGKRPKDPIEQAWQQPHAHHDGRGRSKRVRQDLEDEPNKSAQATSAPRIWFLLCWSYAEEQSVGEEFKGRGGKLTERRPSLRADDPLSDINGACAIADARTAAIDFCWDGERLFAVCDKRRRERGGRNAN